MPQRGRKGSSSKRGTAPSLLVQALMRSRTLREEGLSPLEFEGDLLAIDEIEDGDNDIESVYQAEEGSDHEAEEDMGEIDEDSEYEFEGGDDEESEYEYVEEDDEDSEYEYVEDEDEESDYEFENEASDDEYEENNESQHDDEYEDEEYDEGDASDSDYVYDSRSSGSSDDSSPSSVFDSPSSISQRYDQDESVLVAECSEEILLDGIRLNVEASTSFETTLSRRSSVSSIKRPRSLEEDIMNKVLILAGTQRRTKACRTEPEDAILAKVSKAHLNQKRLDLCLKQSPDFSVQYNRSAV